MRVVVGLIAFYLLLDFSDPGLPGAFNFSADDSVEVVQAQKIDPTEGSVAVEPEATYAPIDARCDDTARVMAVALWVAPTSRQWRRTLLRPRIKYPASEEAPPASLAA